ncbi:MAG: hypothetical protein FK730_01965 [Asgard group archaeon]|nr:hypothetical protein [Asgard group archaeon]
MKFSEREGYVKKSIQIEIVNPDLRNRLWTIFIKALERLDSIEKGSLLRKIWTDEMKLPIDDFPKEPKKPDGERWEVSGALSGYGQYIENKEIAEYEDVLLPVYADELIEMQIKIKNYFLSSEWFKVYDFLEFLIKRNQLSKNKKNIINECNKVLEEESSGYRFIEEFITPNISGDEIIEIEKALKNPIEAIKEHIKQAIIQLSNRKNKDYRNSIKESISAVESLCRIISKNPKATLGDALNFIENSGNVELHPALKDAFSKLYGWTSDKKSGIRHGWSEVTKHELEDARFMLIACSAFINYLTEKSNKAGIKLKEN